MTKTGRFGKYGGQFVSETLMSALIDLETAYRRAQADPNSRDYRLSMPVEKRR